MSGMKLMPDKEFKIWLQNFVEDHYQGGLAQYLENAQNPQKVREIFGLSNEKFSHQFITIALPSTMPMETLRHKLSNIHINQKSSGMTNKVWLRDAIMSVEWYSENQPDGGNLHLHILKPKNYQKSKIIRDFSKHFKVEPNFIDVRAGVFMNDYHNRKNYILGEKQSAAKQQFVVADRIWRKENGLQDVYYL